MHFLFGLCEIKFRFLECGWVILGPPQILADKSNEPYEGLRNLSGLKKIFKRINFVVLRNSIVVYCVERFSCCYGDKPAKKIKSTI